MGESGFLVFDAGGFLAFGECIACKRVFGFNPVRVPSSSAITGKREPICGDCIVRINRKRVELGFAAVEVAADAYDACDESEL
jgi:hypothetical protein